MPMLISPLALPESFDFVSPCLAASGFAFASESWGWTAVGLGLIAAVILFLGYRTSPLRGIARTGALSLKLLGFILLALALMEPVMLDELPRKNANDLAVMADNSSGMTITLGEQFPAPAKSLQEALAGEAPGTFPDWLSTLDDTFRLQPFVFDRSLRRVDDFSELEFSRSRSDLVAAISRTRDRFEKRPLAAVIALTDGNATDLVALDEMLESWSSDSENPAPPVFPILIGENNPEAQDLAIQQVDAETTQFEDAQVTLQIEAAARGTFPDPVEVFVENADGKELASESVIFPPLQKTSAKSSPSIQTLPVRLQLSAMPPGVSFLRVGIRQTAAEPQTELTDRNNQRHITVNRGSGPYRVLYVSGRPNWEYKFLRRSLAQDSEVELVGLIRIAKREPKFEWRGRTGESSNPLFRGFNSDVPEETQKYDEPVLIRLNTSSPEELRDGFPKDAEDLFEPYRAIIFDDLEAEFLTGEQQLLIDQFVSQRGGTLVMLGGQESFRSGTWQNTAVGRLLPVYLDRLRTSAPSLEAAYNLTREGWLEPWMRLRAGKEEETNRLAYMPPFFAINQVSAIKPGANVLATVIDSERRTIPAVVTQRYGEGKSAAVTIADYWRWGMKDSEQQENLAKSWRQLLRWSVHEVPTRVQMEKTEVESGPLPLTQLSIRVRNERFEPQDDANVQLTISHLDGTTSTLSAEPSLEEPGLFTAEYATENEMGYQVSAIVLDGDGNEIGRDQVARALNPESEEFARLGPNRNPLEKIAAATGGEVLEVAQLEELAERLKELDLPVSEVRQRPLWHTPWLFLLALGCFVGEWIIRRRAGVL
ncbi:MAG: glutamine amidotransferase [Verrucomicrobiota bacterium]